MTIGTRQFEAFYRADNPSADSARLICFLLWVMSPQKVYLMETHTQMIICNWYDDDLHNFATYLIYVAFFVWT